MSTHSPGFKSFSRFFLHHFVLAELATSSLKVNTFPLFKDMPYQKMTARLRLNSFQHFLALWIFQTTAL